MFDRLKRWAKQAKMNVYALYLACKDPRVPWYAKWFSVIIVAYAFSPIDLIPDFLPVLGVLDELLLLPAAITLAVKLLPEEVIKDCRTKAEEMMKREKPKNWVAGAVILLVWILIGGWAATILFRSLF